MRKNNLVLTDELIEATEPPAGKDSIIVWDGMVPGFRCRISRTGARTFVLFFRSKKGGKQNVISLGRYKDPITPVTTVQARAKAVEILKADRTEDAPWSPESVPKKKVAITASLEKLPELLEILHLKLGMKEQQATDELDVVEMRHDAALAKDIARIIRMALES